MTPEENTTPPSVRGKSLLEPPLSCNLRYQTKEEIFEEFLPLIEKVIDERADAKIKSHEIRVGWVSGVIGALFVFGIVHSILLMKSWVLL